MTSEKIPEVEIREWNVNTFFQPEFLGHEKYALIVLNRPILCPSQFLIPFWNKAIIRITVDGGTDRWKNYLEKNSLHNKEIIPTDIVCGDFDSIKEETLSSVKNAGVEVFQTPNQHETDFTKSLRILERHRVEKALDFDNVVVLCQSSGRIDQIMANINTLYKCLRQPILPSEKNIFLLSHDSISWLLAPGSHTVAIPDCIRDSRNSWCGLIPVGEKCGRITTSGLKWNLVEGTMEFGNIVSTSNSFNGENCVKINSSSTLLWCMDIKPLFRTYYDVTDDDD